MNHGSVVCGGTATNTQGQQEKAVSSTQCIERTSAKEASRENAIDELRLEGWQGSTEQEDHRCVRVFDDGESTVQGEESISPKKGAGSLGEWDLFADDKRTGQLCQDRRYGDNEDMR